MRVGLVLCACIAASAAVAAIVAFSDDSGSPDAANEPGSGRAPRAQVRGCAQRVEGVARITPRRGRDTVIGPLALIALPVTYRDFSSRPISELEPDPRVGMTLMKAIAWLRAGASVTVVVPEDQRPWMRLVYERPEARGLHAITLRACSRRYAELHVGRGYTEFNGAVAVDFESTPDDADCAELIVWIEGREEPLRRPAFGQRCETSMRGGTSVRDGRAGSGAGRG